jgi:hypothetical protein
MTNVLIVTALELRHPMTLIVQVEPGDSTRDQHAHVAQRLS